MKRLAELINRCLEKNIPFVTFSLPGRSGIQTWIQKSGGFLMAERFEEVAAKSGFVYAPFHRKTDFPVVFFEPEIIIHNEDFEDELLREISASKPLYPNYKVQVPVEISKAEYLHQAETFIHSFTDQLPKAVLSRVKLLDKPGDFSAGACFLNLQAAYPDAFCHLIGIPGNGIWMGATPEILLQMDQHIARTIALAGTRPKPAEGHPVGWQQKEIEEQAIVRDFVIQVLKDFYIDNFRQKTTDNKIAGNLVHLITEFEFDTGLLKNNLAKFIEKLHPTPAVCGLPKEQALNLILKTEMHNREYYAGFCGPLNYLEHTELFVNLRCMKILPQKLALFLGGGLTDKSMPLNEWEETLLKAETLMKLI